MVRNYMEEMVNGYLDEVLLSEKRDHRFDEICKCEQCTDDMRAMALNHLKPFYITCKKGEVYGQFHNLVQQNRADVIREVVGAIEFISKHSHR